MKIKPLTVILYCVIISFHRGKTDSANNILIRGDTIYIFSDEVATYNEAENSCQSYGGQIAQLRDQREKKAFDYIFDHYIFQKYLDQARGRLTVVDILVNPLSTYRLTLSGTESIQQDLQYKAYKFRSQGYMDQTGINGFHTPTDNNMLQRFWLYEQPVENFDREVIFCAYNGRDNIRESCINGWEFNFNRYGGNRSSENTIKIYNYVHPITAITSQLSLTPRNHPDFSAQEVDIYIPDISLFIGARSDEGQSDWFWNNGTRINDPILPNSNRFVCQQMTWPLTYYDGVSLRPKHCESGTSHYICEIQFNPKFSRFGCDGPFKLSWNSFPNSFDYSVTIEVFTGYDRREVTTSLLGSHYIFHNFELHESYSVEVTFQIIEITQRVSTTVKGEVVTFRNITNAKAINTFPSTCEISWNYDLSDDDINSFFKLFASYSNLPLMNVTELSAPLNNTFQHTLPLSEFPSETPIFFKIKVVSCNKESDLMDVVGSCLLMSDETIKNTPDEISDADSSLLPWQAAVIASAGILIIILSAVVVVIRWRKRSNSKVLSSTDEEDVYAQIVFSAERSARKKSSNGRTPKRELPIPQEQMPYNDTEVRNEDAGDDDENDEASNSSEARMATLNTNYMNVTAANTHDHYVYMKSVAPFGDEALRLAKSFSIS